MVISRDEPFVFMREVFARLSWEAGEDGWLPSSQLLVNIKLHASICFRRVPLLEEFTEHSAFCGAKSGTQGRVIVLGENSSQTVVCIYVYGR